MTTVERCFRLEAPEGLGSKPRPELIGPVLTHVQSTLQDSVRMGFLHASRMRGRIPAALKAAAEVRYLGHSAANDEGTLLRFEVPTFGSAAPELFAQHQLWDDGPKPDDTAFELLSGWLHDVQQRQRNSSRFDPGLLLRVRNYSRLVGRQRGLSRITLPDVAAKQAGLIDASLVLAAKELNDATPAARRVRVAGTLDLLGVSDKVLKLKIDDAVVTAVWHQEQSVVDLAGLLGKDVMLEGEAVFRPSGTLLRIDADAIRPATAQDHYFRRLPSPAAAKDQIKTIRTKPWETSAFQAIRGAIAAEESDEDFAAAVDALS